MAAHRLQVVASHVSEHCAAASDASSQVLPMPDAEAGHRLAVVVRSACDGDRVGNDAGGVVWFEHANIRVGDPSLAEIFYFAGLGFTRDPERDVGTTMWGNLGRHQLHLPACGPGETPQVLPGSIGLALPSLPALRKRLSSVAGQLKDSHFAWRDDSTPDLEVITVRCPQGNIFHCYDCALPKCDPLPPGAPTMDKLHHGVGKSMGVQGSLPGIRFVHTFSRDAAGVARWYERMLNANVSVHGSDAAVEAGPGTHLVFSTQAGTPVRDHGVHVAVYVSNFRSSYERIKRAGAVWTNPRFVELDKCDTWDEAVAGQQYRFRDVVDERGVFLCELEHETRSTRHLQYAKTLYYRQR